MRNATYFGRNKIFTVFKCLVFTSAGWILIALIKLKVSNFNRIIRSFFTCHTLHWLWDKILTFERKENFPNLKSCSATTREISLDKEKSCYQIIIILRDSKFKYRSHERWLIKKMLILYNIFRIHALKTFL